MATPIARLMALAAAGKLSPAQEAEYALLERNGIVDTRASSADGDRHTKPGRAESDSPESYAVRVALLAAMDRGDQPVITTTAPVARRAAPQTPYKHRVMETASPISMTFGAAAAPATPTHDGKPGQSTGILNDKRVSEKRPDELSFADIAITNAADTILPPRTYVPDHLMTLGHSSGTFARDIGGNATKSTLTFSDTFNPYALPTVPAPVAHAPVLAAKKVIHSIKLDGPILAEQPLAPPTPSFFH